MPKILIWRNIVFLIFSVDIKESRRHIHVVKKSVKEFAPAKIWMEPTVEVDKQGDFTLKEINKIHNLVLEFEVDINRQLDSFVKGEKINIIYK